MPYIGGMRVRRYGAGKEQLMKILVIEDDRTTAAYISDGLRQEGHSVDQIGRAHV